MVVTLSRLIDLCLILLLWSSIKYTHWNLQIKGHILIISVLVQNSVLLNGLCISLILFLLIVMLILSLAVLVHCILGDQFQISSN